MNETSRDILNRILSLKNFIEKLRPKCKVIISNIIYRSGNGKASLTVKNVNNHLDALNIDIVDNRNIGGNCLTNSGLHLNRTGYGKLAINFIKKMKTLSRNWWSLDSFCCSPNNCHKVSYKITEFDKGKTRDKEHNSSQSAKINESGNNLSILDRVRLNQADRLIIGHLNINFLRNKFERLRKIVQDKLDILLVSETKVDPSFPSSQFATKGFSFPFRFDRNSSEGGICYLLGKKFLPNVYINTSQTAQLKIYS